MEKLLKMALDLFKAGKSIDDVSLAIISSDDAKVKSDLFISENHFY